MREREGRRGRKEERERKTGKKLVERNIKIKVVNMRCEREITLDRISKIRMKEKNKNSY